MNVTDKRKLKLIKNPIENLNKIFDSRIRLGIMSALIVNASVSYNELKEYIKITDGNLATHLKSLEESGYIKVRKGFIGRKTNTTYSVTKAGEKAFKSHLNALEKMMKSVN
ncbi:MAG: winged helix-turn-helix domain-containing protein [Chitinophagaceae bacterium]